MDLRDLTALIAIAESGSLSAASRRLRLTQPALTASLQRLERAAGAHLVTRHSRGATLTEEGLYVLQKARDVLQEVGQIALVRDMVAQAPAGEVRLGLPTTVAGGLIPELIPLIQARHPLIRLHVVEAMSGVLKDQLQLGRLDLAVLFDSAPLAGLRCTPLLTEAIFLLLPAHHRCAALPALDLAKVAGLPLMLPSTANSIRTRLEAACQAQGLTLNVLADVDSLPGLLGLVRAGYGTVLPKYLAKAEIDAGHIVAVPIASPALRWTLHLATRREAARPRASLAVGEALVETCAALIQRGEWEAWLAR
jgi:LysR family nitrogen assimilation transcriptional regulator